MRRTKEVEELQKQRCENYESKKEALAEDA